MQSLGPHGPQSRVDSERLLLPAGKPATYLLRKVKSDEQAGAWTLQPLLRHSRKLRLPAARGPIGLCRVRVESLSIPMSSAFGLLGREPSPDAHMVSN